MLGLVLPFWLPKGPGTALFLTEEEREFAVKRMRIDAAANGNADVHITRRDFIETMKEWRLWVMTIGGMIAGLSPNGFSVFSPIIIRSLRYSGAIASLLTVPPYILGAIVLWSVAWSSDHYRERTFHMLGGQAIVIIGFAITAGAPQSNIGQRYAGVLIILSGAFVFAPLNAAWLLGNTPEPGKRALMIGFNEWMNLSGIVGSELFKPKYAPSYHTPMYITIGLLLFAWLLFAGVSIALRLINRSRARKIAQMTPEEIEEENLSDVRVGDKKLTFVYGT